MDADAVRQITAALGTIHDPQTSVESRRQAHEFLDQVKQNPDAPLWGWQLASPSNSSLDVVRHFGLSLIDNVLKSKYTQYDDERKLAVRRWVVELCENVQPTDPYYLREKLAVLWVAVAKYSWSPKEWKDMDQTLLNMWSADRTRMALSMDILRILLEDLFMIDDPAAARRSKYLNVQCIEIVLSDGVLNKIYDYRSPEVQSLKADSTGWLMRWCELLAECLPTASQDPESANFAIKALMALKMSLSWVASAAIRESNALELLSRALTIDAIKIKTLATDCLHILFVRNFSIDEDFNAIIGAVFLPTGIQTLTEVYRSSKLSLDDFDDNWYIFMKKLVEIIVGLGEYLNVVKSRLPAERDLEGYLNLVFETTSHPSLILSGLSLSFWCSVLRIDELASTPEVQKLLPSMLELATKRILRFEDLDEENNDTIKYLELDFDTMPEMHAFLGNYRRLMEDMARLVVCQIPFDSVTWIRNQMANFFSSWSGWRPASRDQVLTKKSNIYLYASAQLNMVTPVLTGVSRWNNWYTGSDKSDKKAELDNLITTWCEELTNMDITDPLLLRQHIQILVQFASPLKDVSLPHMFRVLEKVLWACTYEYPFDGEPSDEMRELIRDVRSSSCTELNRMAYLMPVALMQIYDDLERVVENVIASGKLSESEVVSFKSFLLAASQQADAPNKGEIFKKIVDPVLSRWSEESTVKGLTQLAWFMERVNLVEIAEYFRRRGVTAETDLLATPMDDEGKALKAELKRNWSLLFPIRPTRIFIQYTIAKLNPDGKQFKDLLEMWKPRVQPILPHILQLITQIRAYHDPENWNGLPPEVQTFVKYSTTERFWHIGISTKTRDEFVDDNVKAAKTLRDFADSLAHMLRYTREYAFLTLSSISQLKETLYEIDGIGKTLWIALAGNSAGISLHTWRHMVNLVVRPVVKNCPNNNLVPFMTDFLPLALTQLDQVLEEKWTHMVANGLQLAGNDEDDETLSEEMMEEHLLRQLTSVVAKLLVELVGPLSQTPLKTVEVGKAAASKVDENTPLLPTVPIRQVVLDNIDVLVPYLKIVSHFLVLKQTHSSFVCFQILRMITPLVLLKNDEIDEYFCNNILKNCLAVVNDNTLLELQPEASAVLTIIYTTLRTKSYSPYNTFLEVIPGNSPSKMQYLESQLSEAASLNSQRGAVMEFFLMIKASSGEADSEEARKELLRKQQKRQQVAKWTIKKSNKPFTDSANDALDDNSLPGLFNEEQE